MTDLPLLPDGGVRERAEDGAERVRDVLRFDGAVPMTRPIPTIADAVSLRRLPATADDDAQHVSIPTSYALASAPRGGRFAFSALVLALVALVLVLPPATLPEAAVACLGSIACAIVASIRRTRRDGLVSAAMSIVVLAVILGVGGVIAQTV